MRTRVHPNVSDPYGTHRFGLRAIQLVCVTCKINIDIRWKHRSISSSGLQELNSKQHLNRQQRKWLVAWKVNGLSFLKIFHIQLRSNSYTSTPPPRVRNPTAAGVAPRSARITNWTNNRRTTLSRLKTSRVYRLCTGPIRTKATVFWWKWLWTMCWKFGNYCYHFVCHYMMNTMAKHWWI